jgi:Protein of unknown function with HXXEE motif
MASAIAWLEKNGSHAAPFLAVFSIAFLFAFRGQMDTVIFLIWLQTPVYLLHQTEEYILPGGFLRFFNRNILGSDQEEFPAGLSLSLWINVLIIYIAFPGSAILAMQYGAWLGLWAAYFSILNAASHAVMFFRFGYNPGLVVSAVLNIPIGVLTVWYFVANGIASGGEHLISLLIAVAVQAGMMIYGFLILKPRSKKASG